MKDVHVHICAPVFGPAAKAGARRAYAQVLACEVSHGAEELSGCRVARFVVTNATELDDWNLGHVFAVAKRSLDLSQAVKVAQVAPERLSSGIMTPLRNFRTDLYDIDLGSLSAAEFHNLGRTYDFKVYGLLERLLDAYDMHNWRARIAVGMSGQTERTMEDCLNQLSALGPGVVRLNPLAHPAVRVDAVCERVEQAQQALVGRGYRRVSVCEYALEPFVPLVEAHIEEPPDYWGFGLGALSLMDGCVVQNVADLTDYVACTDGDAAQTAVRLDKRTLACNHALYALESLAGLGLNAFAARYGNELTPFFESLCQRGLAICEDGRVVLTTRGAVLLDGIREELQGDRRGNP